MLPPVLALSAALAFGLCIGSFLNVVIARLPEGKSLVFPPSSCPRCGHLIAWFDNVPVLSWLLLRGRCRSCRESISWRYPAGEALTGALFVAAFLRFRISADLVVALIFLCALVAITGIDLDRQVIPDVITLPGIAVGFVLNLATQRIPWLDSLLGILVGGGIFFVIILISPSGMGGGDLKLGAMMGAFLGWKLGLLAILLGVLSGGLVAVCLLALGRKGRKDAVPFGPFLALGGALSMLWGKSILAWYFARFGL
jgi:leader peptidase (prepilin peptidase)/N-methyltransferase